MKKVWIFAFALLFVSAAGFAETPSQPPLTSEALAIILSQPGDPGACATQQSGAVFAAKRPGIGLKATCTAACDSGSVSCTGTTCTAANRNCPNEIGHVTCTTNGVSTTTSCTPTTCPTPCSTGTVKERQCCQCDLTGDCLACCRCGGGGVIACSRDCGS
jgi:hypothetical protein